MFCMSDVINLYELRQNRKMYIGANWLSRWYVLEKFSLSNFVRSYMSTTTNRTFSNHHEMYLATAEDYISESFIQLKISIYIMISSYFIFVDTFKWLLVNRWNLNAHSNWPKNECMLRIKMVETNIYLWAGINDDGYQMRIYIYIYKCVNRAEIALNQIAWFGSNYIGVAFIFRSIS